MIIRAITMSRFKLPDCSVGIPRFARSPGYTARAVFYRRRRELHKAYREGLEVRLVVNAVVMRNTRYMEQAIALMRQSNRGASLTPRA